MANLYLRRGPGLLDLPKNAIMNCCIKWFFGLIVVSAIISLTGCKKEPLPKVSAEVCPVGNYVQITSGFSLPDHTITFRTQKQIDDFSRDYPDCVDLSKLWVYITGTVRDLNGLSRLTSVRGLNITNTSSLENLNGLENLTSILGRVLISGNQGLKDLSGLSGFTSVGLEIENNDALTSLHGLENLTAVGLKISGNASLKSLEGLENVSSIGTLEIYENDALLNLKGLKNVASIGY